MNMALNNQMQMVFGYDNNITVRNGQQLPEMSPWQPLIEFLYPIIA